MKKIKCECVSEAEYKILDKYKVGKKISKGDKFLLEELAEEGLLRLGTDYENRYGTARTTDLGKRMIEE